MSGIFRQPFARPLTDYPSRIRFCLLGCAHKNRDNGKCQYAPRILDRFDKHTFAQLLCCAEIIIASWISCIAGGEWLGSLHDPTELDTPVSRRWFPPSWRWRNWTLMQRIARRCWIMEFPILYHDKAYWLCDAHVIMWIMDISLGWRCVWCGIGEV